MSPKIRHPVASDGTTGCASSAELRGPPPEMFRLDLPALGARVAAPQARGAYPPSYSKWLEHQHRDLPVGLRLVLGVVGPMPRPPDPTTTRSSRRR